MTKLSEPKRAIIGAPSSIGLRPDHGTGQPQQVEHAPAALRRQRLVERLSFADLGDVAPPPYRDFVRPPGRPRNEPELADYNRALADRITLGLRDHGALLVLGGDCSIVLGCLLGARSVSERIGLVYVDAHADFATPEESQTGSAASMALALAVGHGDSVLATLAGPAGLVSAGDVALVGRRDAGQPYGHAALGQSAILDLPDGSLDERSTAATAEAVLGRVAREGLDGFWVLVDCDVLNPNVMPAVGSPEPGGPGIDELGPFLRHLMEHPKALGLAFTLYDPSLDNEEMCAERLVTLAAAAFSNLVASDLDSTSDRGR
jgi:arginase